MDDNKMDFLKNIPGYQQWTKVEPILKGWSDDKKYFVEDQLGHQYVLRLASISKYDFKKVEFEYLNQLVKTGIYMTKPVEFGVCEEFVYTKFQWIDGQDAEVALSKLSQKEHYQLGLDAGMALKGIHTLSPHHNLEDWSIRYKRKIQKKLELYANCGITFKNDKAFIKCIEDNLHLLDDRPQTFQHGDYHVGNLLITSSKKLAIIDFNRYDFGDPWEEFNRLIFSWKVSKSFALGQIHGYFNDEVPEKFFRLLALYLSVNAISSIPWAIPFGDDEVAFMMNNIEEINNVYEGFKTYIPIWYHKNGTF